MILKKKIIGITVDVQTLLAAVNANPVIKIESKCLSIVPKFSNDFTFTFNNDLSTPAQAAERSCAAAEFW